jgi:hypothetical protein
VNAGGAEGDLRSVCVEVGHWMLLFAVAAAEHNAAVMTVARPKTPKASQPHARA